MHGKDTSIEELLDWRPYDYFTYRNTVPTPGPIRFLVTTEFEEHARRRPSCTSASQRPRQPRSGPSWRR